MPAFLQKNFRRINLWFCLGSGKHFYTLLGGYRATYCAVHETQCVDYYSLSLIDWPLMVQ